MDVKICQVMSHVVPPEHHLWWWDQCTGIWQRSLPLQLNVCKFTVRICQNDYEKKHITIEPSPSVTHCGIFMYFYGSRSASSVDVIAVYC